MVYTGAVNLPSAVAGCFPFSAMGSTYRGIRSEGAVHAQSAKQCVKLQERLRDELQKIAISRNVRWRMCGVLLLANTLELETTNARPIGKHTLVHEHHIRCLVTYVEVLPIFYSS